MRDVQCLQLELKGGAAVSCEHQGLSGVCVRHGQRRQVVVLQEDGLALGHALRGQVGVAEGVVAVAQRAIASPYGSLILQVNREIHRRTLELHRRLHVPEARAGVTLGEVGVHFEPLDGNGHLTGRLRCLQGAACMIQRPVVVAPQLADLTQDPIGLHLEVRILGVRGDLQCVVCVKLRHLERVPLPLVQTILGAGQQLRMQLLISDGGFFRSQRGAIGGVKGGQIGSVCLLVHLYFFGLDLLIVVHPCHSFKSFTRMISFVISRSLRLN
mmetsp:Transcript_1341/g.2352  ORF Transcript_1341/g.2352 Transcript_1341/m.2352 type:complete len:270 (-) Transcript_1341:870-1679(-)